MTSIVKVIGTQRIPRCGPVLVLMEGVPPAQAKPLVELLRERNPEAVGVILDSGVTVDLLDDERIMRLFGMLAARLPPELLRQAGFTRLT